MNLTDVINASYPKKARKRLGRGTGSGQGKTAGRGHKGQGSRAGFSMHPLFEGGQMPLARRVPKRGFTNIFRQEYSEINLDRLDRIAKNEIEIKDMVEARLIKRVSERVKILGRGELSSAKTVHAHKFSESARKKIEEKGGKILVIGKR